jgi:hypothetical protein
LSLPFWIFLVELLIGEDHNRFFFGSIARIKRLTVELTKYDKRNAMKQLTHNTNHHNHQKGEEKMITLSRLSTVLFVAALCFGLMGVTASGQLVQKTSAGFPGTTRGYTVYAGFTSAPTSGNLLVAIVSAARYDHAVSITEIPSGWTEAIAGGASSSYIYQGIYWKKSDGSETGSISFTLSIDNAYREIQLFEYQQIDLSGSPVDGTSSAIGTSGSPIDPGSVSVSQAPGLILVGVAAHTDYVGVPTFTFSSPSTELNDAALGSSPYAGFGSAERIVNAVGSYDITATQDLATDNWIAQIVSFKGAGALPIQMASFAANVVRDSQVEVAWKTVSETNNYGFEIYRKRGDAGDWAKIGFVQGHGTTLAPQSYAYVDAGLSFGKYIYRIKQVDLDGRSETFPEMAVTVGAGEFVLAQNYPNPFNPSTLIEFVVPQTGFTTMKVYNVLGQEVASLFEGNAEAGKINTARFNASNLPNGMYFYTLRSAGKVETKRMILMK